MNDCTWSRIVSIVYLVWRQHKVGLVPNEVEAVVAGEDPICVRFYGLKKPKQHGTRKTSPCSSGIPYRECTFPLQGPCLSIDQAQLFALHGVFEVLELNLITGIHASHRHVRPLVVLQSPFVDDHKAIKHSHALHIMHDNTKVRLIKLFLHVPCLFPPSSLSSGHAVREIVACTYLDQQVISNCAVNGEKWKCMVRIR